MDYGDVRGLVFVAFGEATEGYITWLTAGLRLRDCSRGGRVLRGSWGWFWAKLGVS